MTSLRWGILGTGGIAGAFARDALLNALTLAAVGSRAEATARAFAETHRIPRAHGSMHALLADPEVDIVYIATPHPAHAEGAIAAMEAGKHVLVEKPFTLTGAHAEAVAEASRRTGRFAMEAMWTRYLPHMDAVREVIASGMLGDIRTVWADHTQSLPTDPGHRLNALDLGGGALLDLGVYPVSFVVDVLGMPEQITARGRLGNTGADTEVATISIHPGGAIGQTVSSSRAAGPNTAHVVGTEARLDIDRVWYKPTGFTVTSPDGTVLHRHEPEAGSSRGMFLQARAAEGFIAEGRTESPRQPLSESVAIMRLLDEVRQQLGVHYPGE